jgi:hypothetical protein
MVFNRCKLEAEQRVTNAQIFEDTERLIAAWNERQQKRMPMLFSPTIGAAIAAGFWFLWVRCPACRTINAIDLRTLDRHHDAAVSSLIPAFVLSVMPAERAVRRVGKAIGNEHRRRNARGASAASAWRLAGRLAWPRHTLSAKVPAVRDVRSDPPRFIPRHQFRRRSPPRLVVQTKVSDAVRSGRAQHNPLS